MGKKAPYGTWTSPITAEAITKSANGVADVVVDRVTSEVYHVETRPSEGGRSVLIHTSSNRELVGEGWDVRTMVQEYGEGNVPEAITPEGKPYRYACLEPIPGYPHLIASVLEDHTHDEPFKVETTLVVINATTTAIATLLSGADFYATPKFSPNGKRIAWLQWFHPDMPWEGGELRVGDVVVAEDGSVTVENETHVAGKRESISAVYPAWADDETLIFTSDESGFINPWKYAQGRASPLFPEPINEDFGRGSWQLHYFPYAFLDKEGKTGLFTAIKDGRDVLYLVDLSGGSNPQLIESPFVAINPIRGIPSVENQVILLAKTTHERETIVKCTLTSTTKANFNVLKAPLGVELGGKPLPSGIISNPRPITLKVAPNGTPLHVVYYPPHNPDYAGTSIGGEKPPCVVNLHGGPTSCESQGLVLGKQFFTSRGWAWLDVNYGGSSGYGRKYIERLQGKWGIVDVEDSITAPKLLSTEPYNLVDPHRLVVRGGSAGGYTVLASISMASDLGVFAAATSLYGVSDLAKLAEFTHKFESRYLDHLVGGNIADIPEVFKERSPINHANKISTPLLILQGEIDRVVPKGQAEAIYDSIKERGGVVEYKLYPGEGHGWKKEPNMRDAFERELEFYERILQLKK